MALVTKIVRVRKDRHRVHSKTKCECSIFELDGARYLQLDTFGSDTRKDRGQISQSLQLDERGAAELFALLAEAFPGPR